MKSRPGDVFDKIAADYRQIHNEAVGFSGADSDHFSQQKVAVVRRLEKGDPSILDLGCGDGNSALYFQRSFPHSRYSGVDTSANSIAVAERRELENANFSTYDGSEIPFEDGHFDIVFASCVLHHIDRPEHDRFLSEARRVLKPGGRIYVFEHNPLNPVTRRVVRDCPFDEGVVLLTARYAVESLKKLNFRPIELAYTLFFPRHSFFRPLHALEPYLGWLPLGGQYYVRGFKP